MAAPWTEMPLRYFSTEWCDGPFGSGLASEHYRDSGARVVRLQNIREAEFAGADEAYVDEEYFTTSLARHNVQEGDVLVAGLGDDNNFVGRACVAPKGLGLALVKADCFRFRLDRAKAEPRFVAYALSATAPQAAGELSGGSTRQRINLGNMAARKLLVPPLSEQVRIADFLDERTARIDALIAEKETLRERVQEYEQAETSRLVRFGLRNRTLIGTDREVLPEAPQGWRVVAFKRALCGIEQGWSPQCESRPAERGEWGVLKVGCVNGTSFDSEENKALPATLEPDLTCVLKKGDVLMSRANTRELVGMAALVNSEHPNLLLCDKLYRLKLRKEWLNPDYAVLLLRSDYVRRQIELGAGGASASMQNISQDVVRELLVALPSVDEQLEIVEAARRTRTACSALSGHVTEHIERLREYRSSLISAAVTGQLEVGAINERIPLAA